MIKYFSEQELACKGTGVVKLDPVFAQKLPELREAHGGPLAVNSVCRTPEHNRNVGGHPRSLHLTENPVHKTGGCCAADISWRGWSDERKLTFAKLAWSLGWSVGLHDGFCHVDRREVAGLPQAAFLYGTWTGNFKPEDVIQ